MLMSIEDFKQNIKDGMFTDYDGFFTIVINGIEDKSNFYYVSDLPGLNVKQIKWYNK